MDDQRAKADGGKLKLTLVPPEIIEAIAVVRMYGNMKYPDGGSDNWKGVSVERYREALCRHLIAYLREPYGVDVESNLPHLFHHACNCAFLCSLEIAAGTIPDAQTALAQMKRPEAPRTDRTAKPSVFTAGRCLSCKYGGRPIYEYPCSGCTPLINRWEAKDERSD